MGHPRFVVLLWLLTLALPAFSQEPAEESLISRQLQGLAGEERMQKLHHLADSLIQRKDSTAITLEKQALDMAYLRSDDELTVECLNLLGNAYTEFHQYEKGFDALRKARSLHAGVTDDKVKCETFRYLGKNHIFAANYDSAEYYLGKGLEILKLAEPPAPDLEAQVKQLIGFNYRYKGDYEKALENYYTALDYYEIQADSEKIYDVRQAIGVISFLRREYKKAEKAFLDFQKYTERTGDESGLGFAYTLLGLVHFGMADYDQSIVYSEKSVETRKKLGDVRGLGESYNNLALAYMGKKEWNSALEFLKMSRDALTRGNDLREIPVILGNIGDCYRKLEQPTEAIRYYQEAIRKCSESGSKHTLSTLYRKLALTYAGTNNFEDAYLTHKRFANVRDSVFTEEKAKAISELELKYEKEKNEQRIAILERDKKIEENRKLGVGIGLALVLVISMLAVALLVTRIRKNKQLFEREKQIIEAREALAQSDLRNARNELELNQSRLSAFMENILQKNALIEQLEAELSELDISNEAENQERQEKLNELLQMKILTDEDWQTFKTHFEQAFPGFLETLSGKYENLTTAETRLFILIKLNLSSKEISNILGVSPDSVKKGRYRLRKKLGLEEEVVLEEFVSEFV